jgi:very-short-patch-repair endonuclease
MSGEFGRDLRRTMTPQEAALWRALRNRRLTGLKFRRQHPLQGTVLDFYCAEAALLIEVDGSYHLRDRHPEMDRVRDETLTQYGLRVLRFSNQQIDGNLGAVLAEIQRAAFPEAEVPGYSPSLPQVERGGRRPG